MCKDCKYYLKNTNMQLFICCLTFKKVDMCDSCDEMDDVE